MTEKTASELAKAAKEVLTEGAKAQAETSKAVTAIVGAAKDAGGFLSRFLGEAPEEFGKMLSERVKLWRLQNLERIVLRVKQIRDRGNLDDEKIKALDFGIAYRLTDAASEEDDETVQELWARLIFNATNATFDTTVKKSYVDILRSIGPHEAIFLDFLSKFRTDRTFESLEALEEFNSAAAAAATDGWRKIKKGDQRAAIQNLIRLRCVTSNPTLKQYGDVLIRMNISQDRLRPNEIITVNPKQFSDLIADIHESMLIASGVREPKLQDIPLYRRGGFPGSVPIGKITVPELNFILTPLGFDLMAACRGPDAS